MHSAQKENSTLEEKLKEKSGDELLSAAEHDAEAPVRPLDTSPKTKFYSTLAFKVLLVYGLLWALCGLLLSDAFMTLLGADSSFIQKISSFKMWIFLLVTGLALYFVVYLLTAKLQRRGNLLEITEKKIARLNRMHRLLSEVNHVILRARDKKQLLREICDIVQNKGNFSFVWMGLGETEAVLPQMIVVSGQGGQYLQDLFDGLQVASAEERGEPALSSFRKKYHVIMNDVKNFSKKQFVWQKRALEHSYHSVAAFPLKTASGLCGVFAMYSSDVDVFTQEDVDLFRELSADIGYGLSDIEQKEKLYYAANYDVITNLPNRPLLEDRLNQAVARANHDKRCVGVAFVELVELEEMINTYGQAAGDKILSETAKHLTRLVRDGDTVARLGNNQLGIMLTDVADPYHIPQVIQKILHPFLVHLTNYREVSVKMKAGVSIYPKDAENAMTLLKNAELALRGILSSEKVDCAFFSREIEVGTQYAKSIEQELEGALERKEFTLYYQPIVDIESRTLKGMETFMRWRNPKLGDVSPVQFITVAEEKGMMTLLGEWTLVSAFMQLKEWAKSGFNSTISVNISSKHLMQPQFLERLKAILTSLQYDPKIHSLAIEVSEDALIDTPKEAIELFSGIRELGVKIFIDDFGTGYASLCYLNTLPIDALKIDPIFIRTFEKDPSAKNLIKGIMAFASGLKVPAIAEGIETEKQLTILAQLGCTLAQGYIFSAPVLAKNIESHFGKPF